MAAADLHSSTQGTSVSISGLSHCYGAAKALDAVDLDVGAGELVALLGPSGCGKTTLLRAIAGLLRPDEGDIRFGDASVIDVPIRRRRVGIVFQNYALFPHMSVADNVAYGLEARGAPRALVRARVEEWLKRVRLDGYAARLPRQLSGGQQQRVALARALATEPSVLLLDEPFAALDKNLRLDMQIEVRRLQRSYGVTTLIVTHDQGEAMSMADRIAVMEGGRIKQVAPPTEVYDRPADLFVNQFLGAANLLPGRIAREGGGVFIDLEAGGRWPAPDPAPAHKECVTVSVRPENLRILREPEGRAALGLVRMALPMGALSIYEIELQDGQTVKAAELRNMGAPMLAQGTAIGLALVSAEAATLFGRASEVGPRL